MKYILSITTAFTVALTVGLTATAHEAHADGADDAIKARQGYFQMIAFNFGGLVAMAKGEREYDAETAKNLAGNMEALSKLHLANLWPEGSDNVAKKGKTRAKTDIWADFPGFGEKGAAFGKAVAALAADAGNGKDGLGPLIGGVGKSCGACHDVYRAKTF